MIVSKNLDTVANTSPVWLKLPMANFGRVYGGKDVKKWKIPVEWKMCGIVEVDAETLTEAIKKFDITMDNIPIPFCRWNNYVPNSFRRLERDDVDRDPPACLKIKDLQRVIGTGRPIYILEKGLETGSWYVLEARSESEPDVDYREIYAYKGMGTEVFTLDDYGKSWVAYLDNPFEINF